MKKLLLFVMAVVLASACTTTKYVEVPVTHTDTLYVSKEKRDSIWLHDSIYLHEWQKGDTIMVDRVVYHTKIHETVRTDTVYQHTTDTVAKPYPVEVKVERELTWWQKLRMRAGEALLVLLAVACAIGVIKLVQKFR